jgi:hypothetical protein
MEKQTTKRTKRPFRKSLHIKFREKRLMYLDSYFVFLKTKNEANEDNN